MGDELSPGEPRGRGVTTHPIRSLVSTLSSHLAPGWSWHYVDGNAFAFILSRASFSLASWSTHWDETVLLQFKNSCDPLNVHPSACDLFRKTTQTTQRDPQFVTTFSLTRVDQLARLMRCLDENSDDAAEEGRRLDEAELHSRISAAVDEPAPILAPEENAVELRHLTAVLKCRDCGTRDCLNWVLDADGAALCAACRLHRQLVANRGSERRKETRKTGDRGGTGLTEQVGERTRTKAVVVGRKKNLKKPGRKPRRIFCPLCDSEFKTKKAYVDHVVLKHDNVIKFKCEYAECDKAYPKKQTLKIHMAQVHGIGETPFDCKFCQKSFATLGTLHSHETAVHSTEIKYHCNFCGRGFTTVGKHNLHVKVKHSSTRPYECQICKKKFALRCILKRHVRETHAEEKQFKCSLCSYACTNQRDVRKHEEAVHQGRRDHVCESCPMRFFNRGGLLRHQRTVHEQRKDFSCRFCGKEFGEKRNMESHERIHTGEKKFKCPNCDYACVDKSNLTKHLRKHVAHAPSCDKTSASSSAPDRETAAFAEVQAVPAGSIAERDDARRQLPLNGTIVGRATALAETELENSSTKVIIHSATPLQFANQQILIPQDAILASIPAGAQELSGSHLRIHVHGSNEAYSVIRS